MGEGVPCDLELLRMVAEQRPPGDLRFRKDTICAASIAGTTMYGAPHAKGAGGRGFKTVGGINRDQFGTKRKEERP